MFADVDHIWDLSPGQYNPGPGNAPRPALPQRELELGAQLTFRLQVQFLFQSLVHRIMKPGGDDQLVLLRPHLE
jgi:hypothetical protein